MLTYSYPVTLAILCPLIFAAAFIDSAAGGGGLIAVPAYLVAGVPDMHVAFGTNKFAMTFAAATATGNYLRKRLVSLPAALAGSVLALAGSALGTYLNTRFSDRALRIILIVMLPAMLAFLFANRSFGGAKRGKPPLEGGALIAVSAAIGLVIGAYDGFFGPGAGMFYTLTLAGIACLDLVTAAGTSRVINFASGLASFLTFFLSRRGYINFSLGIPTMASAIAGSYIGSRLAIKIGVRFIRAVLACAVLLLFAKVLWDVIAPLVREAF